MKTRRLAALLTASLFMAYFNVSAAEKVDNPKNPIGKVAVDKNHRPSPS
jgi:hypothetical protein